MIFKGIVWIGLWHWKLLQKNKVILHDLKYFIVYLYYRMSIIPSVLAENMFIRTISKIIWDSQLETLKI